MNLTKGGESLMWYLVGFGLAVLLLFIYKAHRTASDADDAADSQLRGNDK